MLNYIWTALLVLGIGVALTTDIVDNSTNTFRNGDSLIVNLKIENNYELNSSKSFQGTFTLSKLKFNEFYNQVESNDIESGIKLMKLKNDVHSFVINIKDDSPQLWKIMAASSGEPDELTGKLKINNQLSENLFQAELVFESVTFTKLKDVTNAAIDYANIAVKIAIGLIGVMALWLGIMKIAEEGGLIKIIANSVRPVTRFLFPDIPHDHPAIGAMIMNISANMLGLGNAATPFGLKAMEELDKLNPEKGTATNAMCTFLAINTAGLTLIPTTAIAVRAAAGSSDPTIIIGTSLFGAACATFVGITVAKIFERFSKSKIDFWSSNKNIIISILVFVGVAAILGFTGVLKSFFTLFQFVDADLFRSVIQIISIIAIPLIIFAFLIFGFIKKVKVYEVFVEGAKEGFNVAVRIIPYLVAMLVAIGIFRAGGAMEFLVMIINPVTSLIGMPAEVMPMALMRPLSGSGSIGLMTELISTHGADSFIGVLSSTILGSTETTFYVLAVYFGSVNIRRTRHAVIAGVLADIAGILGALFIVNFLFS
ncbi:MAG: spore maturation protein [Melioribacteraceae bacterium]|nr:spore maturation protein [Melioribacteraceae bacterium]MCF8355374.1 spore maturation protein [Melioribacteraceae bacterium]MCF8394619.1 spore maturation protein [Melioribacteraceae bacterium]MCF8419616.1 spore maturation protein [Melioribacteraceae bacterium]